MNEAEIETLAETIVAKLHEDPIKPAKPEKVEPPEWYSYENFDRCVISFDDLGIEGKVVLRDCTDEADTRVSRTWKTLERGGQESTDATPVEFMRAHLGSSEEHEGGWLKVLNGDPPQKNDAGSWKGYTAAIKRTLLMRLMTGISLFRAAVGQDKLAGES